MSEIKLFEAGSESATEIPGTASTLEKPLQRLFEKNLDTLLGVRFLASEHFTGSIHGGRIDTLGIDENGSPVIIEYKRKISENVINQGMYYLDWLMDHKAEFELLVQKELGTEQSEAIDWTGPRLICVASDFTKFDEHAIRQINRNIDLVRYKKFGDNLLALELATSVTAAGTAPSASLLNDDPSSSDSYVKKYPSDKPLTQVLAEMDNDIAVLVDELRSFINGLGDDVIEKPLKLYFAYRRIKNFASLVIQKKGIKVFLKVDPTTVNLEEGVVSDVRNVGHWGTGDLEVFVQDPASLEIAKPFIIRSYEGQ